MKSDLKAIDAFLQPRKLAFAGVSHDPKKFGFMTYMELKNKGFSVAAINPNCSDLSGDPCYRTIQDLPDDFKHLVILTRKAETLGLVRDAIAKGITHIWIQQMCETKEAIELAKNHSVNLIYKECILMHSQPVKGFHKFHRKLKYLFRFN